VRMETEYRVNVTTMYWWEACQEPPVRLKRQFYRSEADKQSCHVGLSKMY